MKSNLFGVSSVFMGACLTRDLYLMTKYFFTHQSISTRKLCYHEKSVSMFFFFQKGRCLESSNLNGNIFFSVVKISPIGRAVHRANEEGIHALADR